MTGRAAARTAGVLAAYLAIAAVYSHPLLARRHQAIANDKYDPVLNASILWWNATTLPFSPAWWTPPHYYPSRDIAAFTENLTGFGLFTTPILRATDDPVVTYNFAVYLTWPLSAFAAYLLALGLGARPGPAFVGGLAFGFAPYRLGQLAHLQVLACFWLPVALLGLHRYLERRQTRWLVVFGAAWLLQSLTNGYFMLFGAVLIGMWLVFFCSTRATWRLAGPIVAAWAIASLPLLPILLKYREVHAAYGLERGLGAIIFYSADPWSWLSVSPLAAFWGGMLPDSPREANLFPGATAVLVVAAACLWAAARYRFAPVVRTPASGRQRLLRIAAGGLAALSTVAVVITLVNGPWRVAPLGVSIRMSSVDRALTVAVLSIAAFLGLGGRRLRLPDRRSVFGFYVLATAAIVVFCLGPEIRSGTRVVLDQPPYRWLLWFPGFEGLRVPTRFWMIGTLCLAMAAALGLDRLAPVRRAWRIAVVVLASCGVLADGWLREMPMAAAPVHWTAVEPAAGGRALIELPLGPEWDAAATFRAVGHRRRVVNGVSGYDPPHYALLQRGLNARDPSVLHALAALGPIDVIVDASADPGGELARYVTGIPGTRAVTSDGVRTAYRLPDPPAVPVLASGDLTIVSAQASDNDSNARLAVDGDVGTLWTQTPQMSGASLTVDLGTPQAVAGITQALGKGVDAYPRSLAVESSIDGAAWQPAWEGSGLGQTLLALMRAPRDPRIVIPFEPRAARFVRLRLRAGAEAPWSIAEIRVHAPAAR